jgi:muconolactone delta-isomerase
MLFLLHAKLAKPATMSDKEFYGIWQKETEVASAALKAGLINALYKVAGRTEVVAIVEAKAADDIDALLHGMPIWQLGFSHLVYDVILTPLREYASWAEELKNRKLS